MDFNTAFVSGIMQNFKSNKAPAIKNLQHNDLVWEFLIRQATTATIKSRQTLYTKTYSIKPKAFPIVEMQLPALTAVLSQPVHRHLTTTLSTHN